MKQFTYTIKDPDGIHARPAGKFIKEAAKFSSAVTIEVGGKSGDAKRIFAVMGLGAKAGDTVTIKAEGADEDAAAADLERFFAENL